MPCHGCVRNNPSRNDELPGKSQVLSRGCRGVRFGRCRRVEGDRKVSRQLLGCEDWRIRLLIFSGQK